MKQTRMREGETKQKSPYADILDRIQIARLNADAVEVPVN